MEQPTPDKPPKRGSALNVVIIVLLFYISLIVMVGLVFLIIALQSK